MKAVRPRPILVDGMGAAAEEVWNWDWLQEAMLRHQELQRRRVARMMPVLREVRERLTNEPEDSPWRAYFVRLDVLQRDVRSGIGDFSAVLDHVEKGYMMARFEQDPGAQGADVPHTQEELDGLLVVRNPEDLRRMKQEWTE